MEEIEIDDVGIDYFVTVLRLIHGAPVGSPFYFEKYLDVADRFQLPAAKRHLELFCMGSYQNKLYLVKIAEKYQLNDLMDITLPRLEMGNFYRDSGYKPDLEWLEQLSDETNIKVFHRFLEVTNRTIKRPKIKVSQLSICESTFAKSDKTDGILVVDGKKLHINKAVLSHHSDYFNILFNSDFKEKSMKEIEIKDVNFENFATLLSMVHLNPIVPTNRENAMKIVELSDRFFVPCVKILLKPFIYSSPLSNVEKIRIGELYADDKLCQEGIHAMKFYDFTDLPSDPTYQALSSASKRKLFFKSLTLYR